MKIIALILISLFFASTAFAITEADVMNIAKDCVLNVENCDCNAMVEQLASQSGQQADTSSADVQSKISFCQEQVGFGQACMADLGSSECSQIDLTVIENSFTGGRALRSLIEEKVRSYLPEIKNCVNLENCNCAQFPGGVADFCQNYADKQDACLNSYDLEACNMMEAQDIEVLPSWTPEWVRIILEPLIRPLVQLRQDAMRVQAVGSAMSSVGACFRDPYNCDCSTINYASIRADCEERARLMKTCLEYRDCALGSAGNCTGEDTCVGIVNMPLVPETTPGFMKPLLEPIVLQNVCPMMQGWPATNWGNYASCKQ
ncbi:Uncharacterised protein [Candidatus Tiddalikarchaeum anstoanum]|nr:Uncharacterised protein [Candidatus Tiddalikarchaeum anstoanum]